LIGGTLTHAASSPVLRVARETKAFESPGVFANQRMLHRDGYGGLRRSGELALSDMPDEVRAGPFRSADDRNGCREANVAPGRQLYRRRQSQAFRGPTLTPPAATPRLPLSLQPPKRREILNSNALAATAPPPNRNVFICNSSRPLQGDFSVLTGASRSLAQEDGIRNTKRSNRGGLEVQASCSLWIAPWRSGFLNRSLRCRRLGHGRKRSLGDCDFELPRYQRHELRPVGDSADERGYLQVTGNDDRRCK
jgi:hypothetical protein